MILWEAPIYIGSRVRVKATRITWPNLGAEQIYLYGEVVYLFPEESDAVGVQIDEGVLQVFPFRELEVID